MQKENLIRFPLQIKNIICRHHCANQQTTEMAELQINRRHMSLGVGILAHSQKQCIFQQVCVCTKTYVFNYALLAAL